MLCKSFRVLWCIVLKVFTKQQFVCPDFVNIVNCFDMAAKTVWCNSLRLELLSRKISKTLSVHEYWVGNLSITRIGDKPWPSIADHSAIECLYKKQGRHIYNTFILTFLSYYTLANTTKPLHQPVFWVQTPQKYFCFDW